LCMTVLIRYRKPESALFLIIRRRSILKNILRKSALSL